MNRYLKIILNCFVLCFSTMAIAQYTETSGVHVVASPTPTNNPPTQNKPFWGIEKTNKLTFNLEYSKKPIYDFPSDLLILPTPHQARFSATSSSARTHTCDSPIFDCPETTSSPVEIEVDLELDIPVPGLDTFFFSGTGDTRADLYNNNITSRLSLAEENAAINFATSRILGNSRNQYPIARDRTMKEIAYISDRTFSSLLDEFEETHRNFYVLGGGGVLSDYLGVKLNLAGWHRAELAYKRFFNDADFFYTLSRTPFVRNDLEDEARGAIQRVTRGRYRDLAKYAHNFATQRANIIVKDIEETILTDLTYQIDGARETIIEVQNLINRTQNGTRYYENLIYAQKLEFNEIRELYRLANGLQNYDRNNIGKIVFWQQYNAFFGSGVNGSRRVRRVIENTNRIANINDMSYAPGNTIHNQNKIRGQISDIGEISVSPNQHIGYGFLVLEAENQIQNEATQQYVNWMNRSAYRITNYLDRNSNNRATLYLMRYLLETWRSGSLFTGDTFKYRNSVDFIFDPNNPNLVYSSKLYPGALDNGYGNFGYLLSDFFNNIEGSEERRLSFKGRIIGDIFMENSIGNIPLEKLNDNDFLTNLGRLFEIRNGVDSERIDIYFLGNRRPDLLDQGLSTVDNIEQIMEGATIREEGSVFFIDNDGDGFHSSSFVAARIRGELNPNVTNSTNGPDCDDTKPKVHKLNKCKKCEAEPADGKCEEKQKNCTKRTGLLHDANFSDKTPSIGNHTTTAEDNFRNDSWEVIKETNCGNGKIPKGSTVNVLSATPVKRTIGGKTLNYYKVEYEDCPKGNNSNNGNLDSKKPCSDCFKGNPVKGDMQIAKQTASGIKGGTYGDTRTKWKITKDPKTGKTTKKLVPKNHGGVDIKSDFGDPIYAMIGGTATKKTQKKNGKVTGAGHYIQVISKVNGKTIKTWYFHMQDDNRTSGEIKAGDIIGYQGKSGNLGNALKSKTTESHVHIQLYENGVKKNPVDYFKASLATTTGKFTNDSDCK